MTKLMAVFENFVKVTWRAFDSVNLNFKITGYTASSLKLLIYGYTSFQCLLVLAFTYHIGATL